MGVICKERVGGGDIWVENYLLRLTASAVGAKQRCGLGVGGGGGIPLPNLFLKNEGHCGSDFCFLSSYI